jgi:putative transposase
VNRSTYYKHFSKDVAPRVLENQELKTKILTIYSSSKKRLGAYKICRRLFVEYGTSISTGRVYRLMKSMELPKMSTVKPNFKNSAAADNSSCQNLLNQKFYPDKPNLVWTSDITFVRVQGRFCYVCVIIDLFARKVISYKAASKMDTALVLDAFYSALDKRNHPAGIMFHSDRGSQYTSSEFRKALDLADFVQSFSAKGHPYDNAVTESFFKYLKKEELNRRNFSTLAELRQSLFEYIEGFYNPRRPHSANGLLSPDEKEVVFYQ